MKQLKAVIFDLDGTLLDSAADIRQAINATLADHGRRPLTLQEVRDMTGDGLLVQMQRAFAATGAPVSDDQSYSFFQGFIHHYRNQKPDPSQLYPGALDLMLALKQAQIKIGLCTNKQEAATRSLMDHLDLSAHFDFIAGGDTFMVHKPHPGHVQGVLDGLNVAAGDSVFVGDSRNDVAASQGAGVPCILVTHGYGHDVESLGADVMINGFAAFGDALNRLTFAGL
ncbi:MAG: HAD-IA family hydrolase [Alphaproteobacteria bacterium]|nr:HAD-IA family hydrolase [Alphaproteobacteria bacterium]MBV8548463.1 HAD-IA family hydrolase [Alphaproteobacteria bacterium]